MLRTAVFCLEINLGLVIEKKYYSRNGKFESNGLRYNCNVFIILISYCMPLHFPFESYHSSFGRRTEEEKKKKTVAKRKKEANKSHSFSLYPAEVYSQLIPRVLIFHNTTQNNNKHRLEPVSL